MFLYVQAQWKVLYWLFFVADVNKVDVTKWMFTKWLLQKVRTFRKHVHKYLDASLVMLEPKLHIIPITNSPKENVHD